MGNMASIKEGALNLRRVVLLLMTMGLALLLASGVAHAAPTHPLLHIGYHEGGACPAKTSGVHLQSSEDTSLSSESAPAE